jgi:hypothetical protein
MLRFLKYFRKKIAKKLSFFTQNKAKLDHNIGCKEKRHIFAENCGKSQKIVIISSAAGANLTSVSYNCKNLQRHEKPNAF